MSDSFHPDAAKNFQSKAEALASRIAGGDLSTSSSSDFPEPFVAAKLEEKDIKEFHFFKKADIAGIEVARYFEVTDEIVGLDGDA